MAKNGNIHPKRIFRSVKSLQKAWEEYKEDLHDQANEWLRIQYVGKEGNRMEDPQKVPYTLEGFKRYCRERYGDVSGYFENHSNYYDDFVGICAQIREEIRENQIIGGLLGFYNPSITQRLNGLADKTETKVNIEQPLFGDEE
ncbi:DNA-packaging protein gp3 [Arachidicoccus rhizosphaerae]|uniref:DNA-packaging protein gp3 n=1 Tax=Arachidicoccus rhizosphaerae TaxID=551991 RepID=A0A1H4CES7_9BACT|nr:terminase small subunit [Arachidicoccus rhizosphaerae]SEA58874.1 DNA-packaging protein gp3 [Arachidicoccus rhizosphaerae]